jgi:hypothetical protein
MPADVYARKVANAALASAPPQYLSFGGQALGSWLFSFFPRSMRLNIAWKAYSNKIPKV